MSDDSNQALIHLSFFMSCAKNNQHCICFQCQSMGETDDTANDRPHLQYTALHFAVQVGSLQTVQYLISAGADVNVKDNEGLTPLATC